MPLIGLLAMFILGLVCPRAVGAQDRGALSEQEPRFFAMNSAHREPRQIDATQTPVLSRRIAVNFNDVTLDDALHAIAERAGVELAYSTAIIGQGPRVHLKAEEITVAGALSEVLRNLGVDVLFSSNRKAVLFRRGAGPETGTLVGRITDQKSGKALVGAEVWLDNTTRRSVTDSIGRYALTDINAGGYTLMARRLGYAKQSRKVTVHGDGQDTVDLALEPLALKLDELVTTATGQRRRGDIANDITTINADSVMQAAPIRSLTDILENRVPGLTVQRTSGAPGDPARLRLRGASSPLRSNDPIVVVDGIRVYSEQSAARSANLAGGDQLSINNTIAAPSPIDYIDPNTIETIEILKGPSAATLYGQDAANGVIVVTTKKGRPGPARWTTAVEHGRTEMAGAYPNLLMRVGRSLYDNTFTPCPNSGLFSAIPCVGDSLISFQLLSDPALTVLGRGNLNNLSLTVDGGSQALRYAVTGSYGDEIGLVKLPAYEVDRYRSTLGLDPPDWMQRPEHLKRWSVASNITARLSDKADLTLSSNLSRLAQQKSSLEQQLGSLMTTYFNRATGTYYQLVVNQVAPVDPNDFVLLSNYYQRVTAAATQLVNRVTLNWRPRPWLTVTSDAGADVAHRDDQLYFPRGPRNAEGDTTGSVADGQGLSVVSTVNVRSVARVPLGRGFLLQFGAGLNYTGTRIQDLTGETKQLTLGSSSAGALSGFVRQDESSDATFGWYAEPSIGNSKFNFTTGLRLDGGSAYGSHVNGLSLPKFPKLGFSYLISDEPWFPLKDLISSLRLRVAYGRASRQPGPADRLRLYTDQREQYVNGQFQTGVELVTLGNTEVRPERATEFEGGVDADLLESRLNLTLTGYRKTTDDALLPTPVAPSVYGSGVTTIRNIGMTRNTGLEMTVGAQLVRRGPVAWGAQLQLSKSRDMVVKLGPGVTPFYTNGTPSSGGLRVAAGYPLYGRWSRPIAGYADANGDGILQPEEIHLGDTAVYVGATIPNYVAGLSTTLSLWRGALTVDAGFNYVDGLSQLNTLAQKLGFFSVGQQDPRASLAEQVATAPLQVSGGFTQTDYNWIQTVSTVRFDNLSVRYAIPAAVARRLGVQNMSIAVQGANLGLWTNYRGLDPNVNGFGTGNDVQDTGVLPEPRTWQLRVQATY